MKLRDTDNVATTVDFVWDDGKSILTLHDKTQEQAIEIARYFGWTPKVWYRPGTWGNIMRWY